MADTEVEQASEVGAAATPSALEAALLSRARPAAFLSAFEDEMAAVRAGLGDDIVNLASGDPDLPTPTHISEAAVAAIEGGQTHYTPKNGLPALRDAIAGHMLRTVGLDYTPEEICVTAGVQEAMVSCFLALTCAGDEVLVPAPTYLSYHKQTALAGSTCVEVESRAEFDFVVQPADIEAAITPRTKARPPRPPTAPQPLRGLRR